LREIARATYNYFNHDHPFAERPPHEVEELEAIRAGGN